MYKWIWDIPLQDGENMKPFTGDMARTYKKDDEYPAKGIEVSEGHFKYMLGGNKYGNKYIEEVKQTRKKKSEED